MPSCISRLHRGGRIGGGPSEYYANNVAGTLQLLQALVRHGIRHFVFSSSAAVYGNPLQVPIEEEHPTRPRSTPTAGPSFMVETMLADSSRATAALGGPALFQRRRCGRRGRIGEWHDPEAT